MADFTITYNGLTLGPNTDYPVRSLRGLWDRDVDMQTPNLPRYHGGLVGASYHEARVVELEVEVFGDPDAAFTVNRRTLLQAFQPQPIAELPFTFKFPGETTKRVNARPQRGSGEAVTVDTEAGIMVFAFQLVAADPAILEDALSTVQLDVFTSAEGLSYPVTYPKLYGAGGTGGGVQVTNAGDWETWPEFRINGPTSGTLTSPTIENVTTGEKLELTAEGGVSMTSGQQLIIKTHPKDRSVRFATGASRYGKLSDASEFFPLEPGINELRFRASGSTDGATVDVSFRSAWI